MQKTKPPRRRLRLSAQTLRRHFLKTPAQHTAARALGAALGALALSGASLLGRPLPLALAFLVSVPGGLLNFCAFFGLCIGTAAFWGVSAGLTVLASAFLLTCESFLFRELLPREKYWFLPVSAGFFYALLSFFPLLRDRFPPMDTVCAVVCAAAVCGGAYLLLRLPKLRGVLLPTGMLSAAAGVLLLGDLSLGVLAAAAVCCLFLDTENGVFCAALLGLVLDLAPVEPTALSGAFLSAALLCALPLPRKKWLKRPVFLLCCTAFCVFLGKLSAADFVACLLGALLSFALPRRLTAQYAKADADPALQSAALLRAQRVFAEMGTLLTSDEPPKPPTPAAIFDAAAETVCRNCENSGECWQTAAKDTYLALCSAAAKFLPRGHCEEADFPPFFLARCQRSAQFLACCNELLLTFRKTSQYKAKLAETKAVLRGQYASLSRALAALCAQRGASAPPCYRAEVGYRACGVRSARISGDFGCNFEYAGKFYLLLCDGMGTGLLASEQSSAAAGLLRQMILSGFLPADAIETLGGIYALRENGAFSTVDLLEIDLQTADGTLYKSGAAPSFLKVGRRVVRLGRGSLPPGCETVTRCEKFSVCLGGGALLALVSDGLDEDRAEQTLLCTRKSAPTELAAELLTAAGRRTDDCSAAVVRFAELPHT